MKNLITLQEYIGKVQGNGSFVIPDYQRGYVWGQLKRSQTDGGQKDSVTYLVESIKESYNGEKDIFMQGMTVCEEGSDVVVVDGQQRTTFFYLLLAYLSGERPFKLKYKIRKASDEFLASLCSQGEFEDIKESEGEDYQDLFFFKKTIRIFNEELKGIDKQGLNDYIRQHVKFLYIDIPKEKATKLFAMMNGNKAVMRQEELIKAELLRCSSKDSHHISAFENTLIRGRLAREWDKWLYWWNQDEVKLFFKTENQLGWLLPLMTDNKDESIFFEQFREKNLKGGDVKTAKDIFRKMRLLQQSIEDAYDDAKTYNRLGAILCIRQPAERYAVLKWYFDLLNKENHEEAERQLERYFDLAFIGMTHTEIVGEDKDQYKEKRESFLEKLASDHLYNECYETGARWLLRCNIIEDCTQERKFNFAIWRERSLEHIFPKSKVAHQDGEQILDFDNNPLPDASGKLLRENIRCDKGCASEHSIGNLVLLYGNNNSEFGKKDFEEKKSMFFTIKDDAGFKSRHLLHTVSVFAHSKWQGEEIAMHKYEEIEHFENAYKEEL